MRKRQWLLLGAHGKSAELGDEVARPQKSIIAQTSNTEPQVATTTVVLDIVWLSTSV